MSERLAASSPNILFSQLPFGTASSLLSVAPLNSNNAIISRVVANQGEALVGKQEFCRTPVNPRNLHADCDFLSLLLPITRLDRH